MGPKGIIAAGHPQTARAGAAVLAEGGNAFDAIVAAGLTTTVAEPVLSSLAGGGFLVAHRRKDRSTRVYDFFVQTPRRRPNAHNLDFHPITADFGAATQEFHIGLGSVATPGLVRGLFRIHRDLGRMPLPEVAAPAIETARSGTRINGFQAYVFDVVQPIYRSSAVTARAYASPSRPGSLLRDGDLFVQSKLADVIDVLSREGDDLFYRGEIGQAIAKACRERGGSLEIGDLSGYEIMLRDPLWVDFSTARIATNPPPSCGGTLIAFALDLLGARPMGRTGFGSFEHLSSLAQVMHLTDKARVDALLQGKDCAGMGADLLDPTRLEPYRRLVLGRAVAARGTTHMSVVDRSGNVASMTVSNGEGCGYLIPDTGIMLNNMLGEEDLNPGGFHRWRENERMASMMTPALVFDGGRTVYATGSGGSNRIRTAVLQIILNLIGFRMDVEAAVNSPRIHLENGQLDIEDGFTDARTERLSRRFPRSKIWPERNLFFGGAHTVSHRHGDEGMIGAGDPRRAGVCITVP